VSAARLSSLYETAPWGRTDQPWFTNAAAEICLDMPPADFMRLLLAIEAELGRVRHERWGPRIIDLDYLLDDQHTSSAVFLTLPHPELENRAFVLAPLAELRPDLILPSGRLIAKRLAELLPTQRLSKMAACPPS